MKSEQDPSSRTMPDRAELLYALAAGGAEALSQVAQRMGYLYRPRVKAEQPARDRTKQEQPTSQLSQAPLTTLSASKLAPVRFWRPVAREYREDLQGRLTPTEPAQSTEMVQLKDLDPGEAGAPAHVPLVAWPRLWRALEDRLRSPRPRRVIDIQRLLRCWARGETLRSLPLRTGLAHAPLTVILDSSERLMPFRRDQRLVLARLARRLGRLSVRRVEARHLLAGRVPVLGPEERVLALTDLGAYDSLRVQQAWATLGLRLRRKLAAAPVAVVLAPAHMWPALPGHGWQAIAWEQSGRSVGQSDLSGTDQAVEKVLQLASVAQRLDAGLLRQLRRMVSAGLEVEQAVWQHEAVIHRDVNGLVLEPEAAKRWRERFKSLPGAQKAAVAHLLCAWHDHVPEILAAEVVSLLAGGLDEGALDAAQLERLISLFASILQRVAREGDQGAGLDVASDAWFGRTSGWSPKELWSHPRLRQALEQASKAHRQRYPEAPLPTGTSPEVLAEERSRDLEVGRLPVVQQAGGFQVGGASMHGSLVTHVESRNGRVVLADGMGAAAEPARSSRPAPPCERSVTFVSDVESLTLEAWQPILDDATSWTCAAGRDSFGLWAAFEVEGVRQRLRWIPPGRFWMGSPEGEQGRGGDEGPRHPVTLTEGYWLAETPCTQELWAAVLGENPSFFEDNHHPVDQVSWDDCQHFLDRLNERYRHLDVRLPTEAEWEYACGAGDRMAMRLDEVAWHESNSKGGTHPVGTRLPNQWGLSDMLGNVHEWCWDRYERYGKGAKLDPEGPNYGSNRVFRGGSWGDRARGLRAASRRRGHPGSRGFFLGFRLSRGRGTGLRGAEPGRAVSEAAGRGTSRRARSQRDLAWVKRLGWAKDGGTDAFGRWASFEVEGVTTRMRWMCPGQFKMGSPEREPGRRENEGPQKHVTLSKGFWIAEIPCTQALWSALVGSNPSRFQSPHRPVETVSWEDVQDFLTALSYRVPELQPRLPTEAQWEYACRVGTSKGTWLGDLELLGPNNAPLLDALAWYGGNSGVGFDLVKGEDSSTWPEKQYDHTVAGTREVALKQPNPWGLYDMLGNVWEWCNDYWSESYPEGPHTDPHGPAEGDERVFRGGSWCTRARSLRAACRSWRHPGFRNYNLGFRLSRGQDP